MNGTYNSGESSTGLAKLKPKTATLEGGTFFMAFMVLFKKIEPKKKKLIFTFNKLKAKKKNINDI